MMNLEKQYHDELRMELAGAQYSATVTGPSSQSNQENAGDEVSIPDAQQIADDNADLSLPMMSRKKRKLYEAVQVSPTLSLYFLFWCMLCHPINIGTYCG